MTKYIFDIIPKKYNPIINTSMRVEATTKLSAYRQYKKFWSCFKIRLKDVIIMKGNKVKW